MKLHEKSWTHWFKNQFNRYQNDLGGVNAMIEKESGNLVGFWGKGYAIEGAKKCKEFAFENNFTDSLISIISIENKPSQKVAIRNGMALEKETTYHDNAVYIFRISTKQPFKAKGF